MVKRAQARKVPDLFALPALAILLLVLVWIGNDVFSAFMARHEVVRELNRAVSLVESGKFEPALAVLLRVRQEAAASARTPAELLLRRWRVFELDFDRRFAEIYENLGKEQVMRADPDAATRAFAMSLAHMPENADLGKMLAQECFFSKNWELGLHATELMARKDPAGAAHLQRYFKRQLGML